MNLNQFASITQRVIAEDGFGEFLPVACFPERQEVRALADLPSDIDIEATATEWAKEIAKPDEEFLIAFKCSAQEFKIIRIVSADKTSAVFLVELGQ